MQCIEEELWLNHMEIIIIIVYRTPYKVANIDDDFQ